MHKTVCSVLCMNAMERRIIMMKELRYTSFHGKELAVKLYYPQQIQEKYPLVVLYFGGGWMLGTIDHFKSQAEAIAKQGFLVATPDYRVYLRDTTTTDVAMKDCFYALKFLGENAENLAVDKSNVFVGGGSAGGHLAISTFMFNNIGNGLTIKGALLFNPVIDTTEKGYTSDAILKMPFKSIIFSPYHNLTQGLPPIVIFHGTKDTTMPFDRTLEFSEKYKSLGNEIELVAYENRKHGFFNLDRTEDDKVYYDTLEKSIRFLKNNLD